MSRSRVVASQPARASAASSLSLAAATVSRLLADSAPAVIACMSTPALVSVSHVFPRSCSARFQERGVRVRAIPRTGRAVGGHRGRGRADARLARGSPGLGRVSSSFNGRRLRVDAVERRSDQQVRLRLVELVQPGLVGIDAQHPHDLRMLLDELDQLLLLPGGDRHVRRFRACPRRRKAPGRDRIGRGRRAA